MKMTVRQKSSGKIHKILADIQETLKEAPQYEVAVGLPVGVGGLGTPEPAYDGKASIIEVALKNNYGIGVPRRAFMDEAREDMEKTYKRVMEGTAPKLRDGTAKLRKVLDLAGGQAEDDIRNSISHGNWQPNSELTIRLKGSDKPLIDTKTMRTRVTHIVRKAER